ncbi:hypothetical protein VTJ83DRAFT_2457 [Remersonia thermophila]|uniref:Uncharacterized protein n=1 Tax=Remersonia thermophila TaxID=72144 RepID=A0ABR4DIT9_9PEZI
MNDREPYVHPTRDSNFNGDGNDLVSQAISDPAEQPQERRVGGRADYETPDKMVYYICGNCGLRCGFQANDPLRCRDCGGRIMYKPRLKILLQFPAV